MASVTIKICGIRDAATAEYAFGQGADFVGLVLTKSPRQLTLDGAQALIREAPGRYIAVVKDVDPGLFQKILDELNVVGVQCHGVLPENWIERVQRTGRIAVSTVVDPLADVVLADGIEPGKGIAREWVKPVVDRPVWIAGGLTRRNVRAVIETLRPEGVDVSSGVERDGEKDRELIQQFIEEVRKCPE